MRLPGQSSRHPKPEAIVLFTLPAPLGALLSFARLLVHHGGIGTALDGLRAGTLLWLFPTAYDQSDNADCLCKLGSRK